MPTRISRMGTYHAEIINKVGAHARRPDLWGEPGGRASNISRPRSSSIRNSAIARIEYANGLAMMFGKAELARATRLYEEAAACPPADAMERLDAELAKSELAD